MGSWRTNLKPDSDRERRYFQSLRSANVELLRRRLAKAVFVAFAPRMRRGPLTPPSPRTRGEGAASGETEASSVRHDRLRGQRGLARRDAGEQRALLEPRGRRRVAPQGLPLRIGQRPADRDVIGIDGEIIGGEQLDPVAVGVADIKKEGVGNAVTAGAALHVGEIARG